jgi:CheY-like chemotaxis protein/transcriptional regulator with XRE-family HTH domain
MIRFEEFKQELQSALGHLYDPDYRPTDILYIGTGCDPGAGARAIQATILQEIENLEPDPTLPRDSRPRRDFEVLHQRFVLKLSQEETAQRMGMSVRSVQRIQREAMHLLAQRIWERAATYEVTLGTSIEDREPALISSKLTEWRFQVKQEIACLQKSATDARADLRATIQGTLRIADVLVEDRDIVLDVAGESSNIYVRSHPSVLRQILLHEIEQLVQIMSAGRISVSAERHAERARIRITGHPIQMTRPVDVSLAQELLSIQGGSIDSLAAGSSISLVIELPIVRQPTGKVTVLAVDDNPDMVTVFQAYCTGTRYEIVHVREGQRVVEAIEVHSPDVILLDVILPDIDGWDLLLNLHANPGTKSIPIIVCSVITAERLALTLGASLYLRKPVYRQQLIQALDQVLNQAPIDAL